jgi:hypothetical protein
MRALRVFVVLQAAPRHTPSDSVMVFTKRLREGVRRGRITCSVRIWTRPHVKAGGRYSMDDGHIVVDSIVAIRRKDITNDLARESGFTDVADLLDTAKHGPGDNIYLIRFHYLPPGAWDTPRTVGENAKRDRLQGRTSELLRRIRHSTPPSSAQHAESIPTSRRGHGRKR